MIGLVSVAHSQDLFTEMQKVKQDIEELKRQVEELRHMVYTLAKPVPRPPASAEKKLPAQPPPGAETRIPNFAQIKPVVCQAIEKYLFALDANLRLQDAITVQTNMSKADTELRAVLMQYSSNPEVARLLELADEMDWDTYSDVAVKHSPESNQAFDEDIARHKKALRSLCEPR
jgi:cell division septum initiation protein DivIVA